LYHATILQVILHRVDEGAQGLLHLHAYNFPLVSAHAFNPQLVEGVHGELELKKFELIREVCKKAPMNGVELVRD